MAFFANSEGHTIFFLNFHAADRGLPVHLPVITISLPLRLFHIWEDPGAFWNERKTRGVHGMKLFSRGLAVGALLLILISTACNLPAQSPTPVGTILPTGGIPTTAVSEEPVSIETPTTLIPVTGSQDVSLQCQFCVNDEPHAVLLLPQSAAFLVSQPVIGVNCITAQVVNDERILFCRGAQQTVFTLNVCFDNTNCLQYPITLATCPLGKQAANPTAVVLTPANQGITPTPPAPTALPTETPTVVPSPTLVPTTAVPPASATATLPPVSATAVPALPTQTLPPTVTTTAPPPSVTATLHASQSRVPATHLPRTALNTPEGFLRWYFASVWNERNYQDLWDNYQTPSFKARPNSGGFEGYEAWWSSVQRVDVNSITVLKNDGTNAWVRVSVTFTMNDGRVISNQEYDYDLFYDAARQTWMFDYRT
jgi:hypothetical protein